MSLDDDYSYQGEGLHISERLIVAPVWGRLRARQLRVGQQLPRGSVIGLLHEGGEEVPLVCGEPAVFLAWLAREGERVSPGRRIAALRIADG